MQNLQDDNHLDRLSREAAEQYEPDQQAHSWEKMLPGLNEALPQKKEKKRRFIFFLLLFLLIGGGITFSMLWKGGGTVVTSNEPVSGNERSTDNSGKPVITDNQTTTAAAKPVTNNSTVVARDKHLNERPDHNKTSRRKNNSIRNQNTYTRPDIFRTKGSNNETADRSTSKEASKETQANTTQNDVPLVNKQEDADKTTDEKIQQTPMPDSSSIKPTTDSSATKEQVKPAVEQPIVQENKTAKKNKKDATPSRHKFEIGVVYAPDISTVKFTHTQKPGMNVGLSLGYNFSKRFSVQTGVLYTSKNYKSHGKDYHPPKGYWTDYVDLITVTANCDMWDIPLNLRYNIAPRKTSNLFVSTGLSTYLMKNETYDYYYYYNGNPVTRGRSYPTNSKYWFSVLNLSVGYEHHLNKRFSLQAEPFFKQPLKGVGFGSVKLNTTGIFFSAKYKMGH